MTYRIVDADTYQDEQTGEVFRLSQANAPEKFTPEGKAAMEDPTLATRLNAATPQRQGRDYYGRTVAKFLNPDQSDLGQAQVEKGSAFPVDYLGSGQNYSTAYKPPEPLTPRQQKMVGEQPVPEMYKASPAMPEPTFMQRLNRSVQRGTDEYQAGLYGGVSAIGELVSRDSKKALAEPEFVKDPKTGKAVRNPQLSLRDRFSNWLIRTGERGYMRNMEEAAQNPATTSLQKAIDSGSAGELLNWAAEAMGSALPSMAEMVGTGLLTAATGGIGGAAVGAARSAAMRASARALVGKMRMRLVENGMTPLIANQTAKGIVENLPQHLARSYASRAANVGQQVGMFGSSALSQGGQTYKDIENEQGIRAPGAALLTGAAQGALDVAGFDLLLNRFLKKGIPVSTARELVKHAVTEASIGTMGEGVTEGVQEIIGTLNEEYHRPSDVPLMERMLSKENLWRYTEAAAAGALFGGVFGGVGAGAKGTYELARAKGRAERKTKAEAEAQAARAKAEADAQAKAEADAQAQAQAQAGQTQTQTGAEQTQATVEQAQATTEPAQADALDERTADETPAPPIQEPTAPITPTESGEESATAEAPAVHVSPETHSSVQVKDLKPADEIVDNQQQPWIVDRVTAHSDGTHTLELGWNGTTKTVKLSSSGVVTKAKTPSAPTTESPTVTPTPEAPAPTAEAPAPTTEPTSEGAPTTPTHTGEPPSEGAPTTPTHTEASQGRRWQQPRTSLSLTEKQGHVFDTAAEARDVASRVLGPLNITSTIAPRKGEKFGLSHRTLEPDIAGAKGTTQAGDTTIPVAVLSALQQTADRIRPEEGPGGLSGMDLVASLAYNAKTEKEVGRVDAPTIIARADDGTSTMPSLQDAYTLALGRGLRPGEFAIRGVTSNKEGLKGYQAINLKPFVQATATDTFAGTSPVGQTFDEQVAAQAAPTPNLVEALQARGETVTRDGNVITSTPASSKSEASWVPTDEQEAQWDASLREPAPTVKAEDESVWADFEAEAPKAEAPNTKLTLDNVEYPSYVQRKFESIAGTLADNLELNIPDDLEWDVAHFTNGFSEIELYRGDTAYPLEQIREQLTKTDAGDSVVRQVEEVNRKLEAAQREYLRSVGIIPFEDQPLFNQQKAATPTEEQKAEAPKAKPKPNVTFSDEESDVPWAESKRTAPTPGTTPQQFEAELQKTIGKRLTRQLLSRPNITVLHRISDAPFTVAADTAGLYLPDGRVFFFTENILPGEAFGKLMHEQGAHYGLRRMLGDALYNHVLQELQRMVAAPEGFQSVKDAHARAVQATGKDSPNLWHETLAYLAEASPRHGLIRRVINAIKQFLLKLGIPVGRLSEKDIVGLVQIAAFRDGVQQGTASPREALESKSEAVQQRVMTALRFLSTDDALFQYKGSDKTDLAGIADDILPGEVTVTKFKVPHPKNSPDALIAAYEIKMGDGKPAAVSEYADGTFHLDASNLESGVSRGTALYHILATYAYNNDKVFVRDPHGMTAAGKYRSLQNLTSSAIRFGTTRHFRLDESQGVKWSDNEAENLLNLLEKSSEDTIAKTPGLEDIRYDFQQDHFVNARTGEKVTDAGFNALREKTAGVAPQTGSATLRRAAFFRSLVQSAGSEVSWQHILGAIDRELSRGVYAGALAGSLYSKRTDSSAPELTILPYQVVEDSGRVKQLWAIWGKGHRIDQFDSQVEAERALAKDRTQYEQDVAGLQEVTPKYSSGAMNQGPVKDLPSGKTPPVPPASPKQREAALRPDTLENLRDPLRVEGLTPKQETVEKPVESSLTLPKVAELPAYQRMAASLVKEFEEARDNVNARRKEQGRPALSEAGQNELRDQLLVDAADELFDARPTALSTFARVVQTIDQGLPRAREVAALDELYNTSHADLEALRGLFGFGAEKLSMPEQWRRAVQLWHLYSGRESSVLEEFFPAKDDGKASAADDRKAAWDVVKKWITGSSSDDDEGALSGMQIERGFEASIPVFRGQHFTKDLAAYLNPRIPKTALGQSESDFLGSLDEADEAMVHDDEALELRLATGALIDLRDKAAAAPEKRASLPMGSVLAWLGLEGELTPIGKAVQQFLADQTVHPRSNVVRAARAVAELPEQLRQRYEGADLQAIYDAYGHEMPLANLVVTFDARTNEYSVTQELVTGNPFTAMMAYDWRTGEVISVKEFVNRYLEGKTDAQEGQWMSEITQLTQAQARAQRKGIEWNQAQSPRGQRLIEAWKAKGLTFKNKFVGVTKKALKAVREAGAFSLDQWSRAELWTPSVLIDDLDKYGGEGAWIRYHLAPEAPQQGAELYQGGFSHAGKGTSQGDGKDQAMREIADAALVELDGRDRASSSRTSLEKLGKPTPASQVVMLARNGSLAGKALRPETLTQLEALAAQGVRFVVGDMPGVDEPFVRELERLGATFTIYHGGDKPRVQRAGAPSKLKMTGTMSFTYKQNDPGARYGSTFEAVKVGARTSTTRFATWPQYESWLALKPGDIVRFYKDKSWSEYVDVVVDGVQKITKTDVERSSTHAEAESSPLFANDARTMYVDALYITQLGRALGKVLGKTFSSDLEAFNEGLIGLKLEADWHLVTPQAELADKDISGSSKRVMLYRDALALDAQKQPKGWEPGSEGRYNYTLDELQQAEEAYKREFDGTKKSHLEGLSAIEQAFADDPQMQDEFVRLFSKLWRTSVNKISRDQRNPEGGQRSPSKAELQRNMLRAINEHRDEYINYQEDERPIEEYREQYGTDIGNAPPAVRDTAMAREQDAEDRKWQEIRSRDDKLGKDSTVATGAPQNLPIPKGGVTASKNTARTNAFKLVKALADALPLKGLNIQVYNDKDIAALTDRLYQQNPLLGLEFETRTTEGRLPAMVTFVGDQVLIYYDSNRTDGEVVDAIGHEMGHVVFRALLNQERVRNTPLWNRLLNDYRLSGSEQGFMEWFADGVKDWVMSRKDAELPEEAMGPELRAFKEARGLLPKVTNAKTRLFKRVVDAIKRILEIIGLKPTPGAVSAYLDGLVLREKTLEQQAFLDGLQGTPYDRLTFAQAVNSTTTPFLNIPHAMDFLTLDGVKKGTLERLHALEERFPKLKTFHRWTHQYFEVAQDIFRTLNGWLRSQNSDELTLLADILDNQARGADQVKLYSNDELRQELTTLLQEQDATEQRVAQEQNRAPRQQYDAMGRAQLLSRLIEQADALRQREGVRGVSMVRFIDPDTGMAKVTPVPVYRESFTEAVRREYQGEWGSGYRKLVFEKSEADLKRWGQELLRNNPQSAEAQAIKEWLDRFYNDYLVPRYTGALSAARGNPVIHIGWLENWGMTRSYNADAVAANPDAFVELLMKYVDDMTLTQAWKLTDAIITGRQLLDDVSDESGDPHTFSPGAKAKKERMLKIPIEELLPFLEQRADKLLDSYVHSMIKRAEWDRRFAEEVEFTNKEGSRYSLQQNHYTDIIKKGAVLNSEDKDTHRRAFLKRRTADVIEAYLGRYKVFETNPQVRAAMSATQVAVNWITMPLSTLSQFPDLIGPLTRMGGGVKELMKGYRDALKAIRDHDGSLWKTAELMGVVFRDTKNLGASAIFDQQFMTEGAQRWNDRLFKYNGMQLFSNFSRIASYATSKYWLESLVGHADGERLLGQVGLTKADVRAWIDGGYKDYTTGDSQDSVPYNIALARLRFVNESVFSPHAGQRPLWANHPYFMLVWHLKSFAYSFFTQILAPAFREVRNNPALYGKMMAVLPMGLMLPMAFLGLGLRDELKNELLPWRTAGLNDAERFERQNTWWENTTRAIGQTGVLGPIQLLLDADRAASWNRSFTFALLGPTASKIEEFYRAESTLDGLLRVTPGLSVLPQERQMLVNWWKRF